MLNLEPVVCIFTMERIAFSGQFIGGLYNSHLCVKLHLLKMNSITVEEFHLLLVLP